jgi:hypothetical protein
MKISNKTIDDQAYETTNQATHRGSGGVRGKISLKRKENQHNRTFFRARANRIARRLDILGDLWITSPLGVLRYLLQSSKASPGVWGQPGETKANRDIPKWQSMPQHGTRHDMGFVV